MPKRFKEDCGQRRGKIASGHRNHGSVAAEFALMAPIIVVIAAGIADFGMLATKSVGLAATARIGAAYARSYPDDTSGIQNAMQTAMGFAPPLIFPVSFLRSCECDDATPIACSESCATVRRPAPNRMFIRITANQPFTPLVPWPGIPAMLTAAAEARLQ
jgi:Flp pilus assembly protein TadG